MVSYQLTGLSKPWTYELMPGLNKLGRNPTNDFRIPDPSVSSFHCEIIVGKDEVEVRDLGSTNGTYIDGQYVQEGTIRLGQVLLLGAAEFRLHEVEVQVRIPSPTVPTREPPVMLPDGSPACSVYHDRPAVYECNNCRKFFCDDAVREVKITGGKILRFGHGCHGPCDLEPKFRPVSEPKPTLLGRLTQTIRMIKP